MAVPGVFPAVAGDAIRLADAAGRQHDGLGLKHLEGAAIPVECESADHALPICQELDHGAFHVHVDLLVDGVVLERADHLQARSVAYVREPRVGVSAEIALQNAPVGRAVEDRPPCFEFANPRGSLLGVQLCHPAVVQVLPPAHRVGEVHFPVVAVIDVRQRGGYTPLSHHRVRLAEKGLADETD